MPKDLPVLPNKERLIDPLHCYRCITVAPANGAAVMA